MDIRRVIRRLMETNRDFRISPEVSDEAPLVEAGVTNSFGLISLVVLLEKEFRFKLGPEDLTPENFVSIRTIGEMIERKTSQ